jgi:DNA-binding response OmpR family regulator
MPPRILIVEADATFRKSLAALLGESGYVVTTADTVLAARHVLRRGAPDLLITDVRLGEDNGLQLVAMADPPIPAIVLTRNFDAVLEADARAFGADYLVKPASPSTLRAVIASKLSKAPGGGDAPADGR